ncbi:conserved mitochondrial protein [Aspergillus luchuensis]|uniref:Conserved mitochondrial protein n=1 Tax=Aspergillus kawachii TaxID=1069201 RepID=A0A146FLL3_ASPKA|nr:conserved mitochondrial protein [Aspergillus luchuensis]
MPLAGMLSSDDGHAFVIRSVGTMRTINSSISTALEM